MSRTRVTAVRCLRGQTMMERCVSLHTLCVCVCVMCSSPCMPCIVCVCVCFSVCVCCCVCLCVLVCVCDCMRVLCMCVLRVCFLCMSVCLSGVSVRVCVCLFGVLKAHQVVAIQLSQDLHGGNPLEVERLRRAHPDEDDVIKNGRVKGRLQPTRGFGDGCVLCVVLCCVVCTRGLRWGVLCVLCVCCVCSVLLCCVVCACLGLCTRACVYSHGVSSL